MHHRRTPSKTLATPTFDVVKHCDDLLIKDPSLTPPIAAMLALIHVLAASPVTTISETIDLLAQTSETLLSSQPNPIPFSAGTELFQRYVIGIFQQRPSSLAAADFNSLRNHLITNSRLFVKRTVQARQKIASYALPFVRDDSTILTYGYSRVVRKILSHAAESRRYFNVIFILPCHLSPTSTTNTSQHETSKLLNSQILELNKLSIPSTTIPFSSLTYAISSLSPSCRPQFLIGASAVLENGSAVSDLGTHQLAILSNFFKIPFHVVVESYKFTRLFSLGSGASDLERMGVEQNVLEFSTTSGFPAGDVPTINTVKSNNNNAKNSGGTGVKAAVEAVTNQENMIEVTPPDLISALVTENGVMTPNAVSEEVIKLWY